MLHDEEKVEENRLIVLIIFTKKNMWARIQAILRAVTTAGLNQIKASRNSNFYPSFFVRLDGKHLWTELELDLTRLF